MIFVSLLNHRKNEPEEKFYRPCFLLASYLCFSQTTNDGMGIAKSKTIVFIHGLFVNPTSWNEWKNYFEAWGYKCYTPANPYHEGNPGDLR
jgi:hypothetical protein